MADLSGEGNRAQPTVEQSDVPGEQNATLQSESTGSQLAKATRDANTFTVVLLAGTFSFFAIVGLFVEVPEALNLVERLGRALCVGAMFLVYGGFILTWLIPIAIAIRYLIAGDIGNQRQSSNRRTNTEPLREPQRQVDNDAFGQDALIFLSTAGMGVFLSWVVSAIWHRVLSHSYEHSLTAILCGLWFGLVFLAVRAIRLREKSRQYRRRNWILQLPGNALQARQKLDLVLNSDTVVSG